MLMSALVSFALLLIGFSVISAGLLALIHFRSANYSERPVAQHMGLLLLTALGGLQIVHWGWLYLDLPWIETALYRMLLFTVAPVFWAFSRSLLKTQDFAVLQPNHLLHVLPIAIAPWLPGKLALPLAFGVGAGYLIFLARDLRRLRADRDEYRQEIILLGTVFVMAAGVAILGVLEAQLPDKLFFIVYAIAIGLAFLLVQIVLGLRPQLSVEIVETAKAAYENSTLLRVDCPAMLRRLDAVMHEERCYEDPGLNLAKLARHLELTGHQLSELVNVHLGKSFSRYLREIRIAAAARMLCAEPSASVLSIGMSVGFSAQSNFYEAFREIEGMTPGQYRKLHTRAVRHATG